MNSEKTQIFRKGLSAPTRWIVGHVDLNGKTILHHGEGKAFEDTLSLGYSGSLVTAYDPNTECNDPVIFERTFDIAVSNYVFNTLPYYERVIAWQNLLATSTRVLVSVRTDTSAWMGKGWTPSNDGFITNRGTFQCIQTSGWWVQWFKWHSPKRTSVSVLHHGGHFCIIDVWR